MEIRVHEVKPVPPPKTYDLVGLSQEEMDMLRYFAARDPRGSAAERFLRKTASMAENTYNPDICFK